jgi:hypothetical protein
MPFHRILPENGRPGDEWSLEWDDATFILKDPDGEPALEVGATRAHRLVEAYDLYAEGKVTFTTPHGALTFKPDQATLVALREFVEENLRSDPEYREELRRHARRSIVLGLMMFVVAGGLFGLYCWWASWAPDPPPGHWIRWFGGLIHGVLLVLMAGAIAGPFVCWFGFRQLLRVRRIEATARE